MTLDYEVTRPVAFSMYEGEEWQNWKLRHQYLNHPRYHAILFADGHIFDMVKGWRPQTQEEYVESEKLAAKFET